MLVFNVFGVYCLLFKVWFLMLFLLDSLFNCACFWVCDAYVVLFRLIVWLWLLFGWVLLSFRLCCLLRCLLYLLSVNSVVWLCLPFIRYGLFYYFVGVNFWFPMLFCFYLLLAVFCLVVRFGLCCWLLVW